jgi:hypothetical protein
MTTAMRSQLDRIKAGYCPACDQEQRLLGFIPANQAHADSFALACGHAVEVLPTDPVALRAKADGTAVVYVNVEDLRRVQRRVGLMTTTSFNPREHITYGYCPSCDQERRLLAGGTAPPLTQLTLDCGHNVALPPEVPAVLRGKQDGTVVLYSSLEELRRVQQRDGKDGVIL